MPFDLSDQSTWQTCTLATGAGQIMYWALPDLEDYDEEAVDGASTASALLACRWQDRIDFRKYARGYAERATTGSGYFNRFAPIKHPELPDHYLVRLKKARVHAGVDSQRNPIPAAADPNAPIPNWWTLPYSGALFPPRIVYLATFTPLPYDVVDQDTFLSTAGISGGLNELQRYVTRSEAVEPKVRKIPTWTWETDESTPVPIDEVGMVPYHDWQLSYVWHRVPYGRYPRTAIETTLNRVNSDVWDFKLDVITGTTYTQAGALTSYGRYRKGDLLFEGMGSKIVPYRSASGDWVVDLHYLFRFQPAESTGDGMLKVPRGGENKWVKIRERGTGTDPALNPAHHMYSYADFNALFQPEPGA